MASMARMWISVLITSFLSHPNLNSNIVWRMVNSKMSKMFGNLRWKIKIRDNYMRKKRGRKINKELKFWAIEWLQRNKRVLTNGLSMQGMIRTRITNPYPSTSERTIRKVMMAIKASLVTQNLPLLMMMKMTQNRYQLKCPPKSM